MSHDIHVCATRPDALDFFPVNPLYRGMSPPKKLDIDPTGVRVTFTEAETPTQRPGYQRVVPIKEVVDPLVESLQRERRSLTGRQQSKKTQPQWIYPRGTPNRSGLGGVYIQDEWAIDTLFADEVPRTVPILPVFFENVVRFWPFEISGYFTTRGRDPAEATVQLKVSGSTETLRYQWHNYLRPENSADLTHCVSRYLQKMLRYFKRGNLAKCLKNMDDPVEISIVKDWFLENEHRVGPFLEKTRLRKRGPAQKRG